MWREGDWRQLEVETIGERGEARACKDRGEVIGSSNEYIKGCPTKPRTCTRVSSLQPAGSARAPVKIFATCLSPCSTFTSTNAALCLAFLTDSHHLSPVTRKMDSLCHPFSLLTCFAWDSRPRSHSDASRIPLSIPFIDSRMHGGALNNPHVSALEMSDLLSRFGCI